MTDLPTDSSGETGAGPPRAPLWVKLFGILALVALVVFVILHLTGRGFGGHMP